MTLTLDQALDTSEALEERLAYERVASVRSDLAHKKMLVDFAAFGLFKQADYGQALGQLAKPLAWGVGLGLPALGVGHALISDAHHQADKLVDRTRNQALMLGGIQAAGQAAPGLLELLRARMQGGGNNDGFKLSADTESLRKLAAFVLVDDVLEQQLNKAPEATKHAVQECLFINRVQGTALLRKLR